MPGSLRVRVRFGAFAMGDALAPLASPPDYGNPEHGRASTGSVRLLSMGSHRAPKMRHRWLVWLGAGLAVAFGIGVLPVLAVLFVH